MSSNWESIDLSSLIPSAVTQAASAITNLVNEFLTLYKTEIELAQKYDAELSGGNGNILATAVQALLDTINGILQAGKVHALFVPMPKQFPTQQKSNLPPTLDDVAYNLGFDFASSGIQLASNANLAYGSLTTGTGGNKGFFQTFVTTLSDMLDQNRPQYFSDEDAVTMAVLLLGAPSFSQLINVAAAFNRAFKPQANNDLQARMVPAPQNLRAKVIGLPAATAIGVQLSWDPAQNTYSSPYFPGVTTVISKYAVIRCTDPDVAQSATHVTDFFNTQTLVAGLTSTDDAKVSTVVAVGSGSNASYVDDDPTLVATQIYYYAIAWQVTVDELGVKTTLPFDRISNVCKTRVRSASPTTQSGPPPDWVAYGSMIDLIPDLAVQVKTILAQIQTLAGRQTGGASGSLTTTLNLILENVSTFADRLDQLNAQAERLNTIFGAPLPGLYATQITGIGGNAFLVGELASRLDDITDPTRPPYDHGEYVMGVCIVGGGPRLADIQPIIDFLSMLFQPAAAKSPLYLALQSLNGLVETQETYVFGQNAQPLPQNADGTVTLPTGETVPASSIDPTTGLQAAVNNPVMADDGTMVSGLDPNNPFMGDP